MYGVQIVNLIIPRARLQVRIWQFSEVTLLAVAHGCTDPVCWLAKWLVLNRNLLPDLGIAAWDVKSTVLSHGVLKIYKSFVISWWRIVGGGWGIPTLELCMTRREPGELGSVLHGVRSIILEFRLGSSLADKLGQVVITRTCNIHVSVHGSDHLTRTRPVRQLVGHWFIIWDDGTH